jgi:Phosphotransferase enzyme family
MTDAPPEVTALVGAAGLGEPVCAAAISTSPRSQVWRIRTDSSETPSLVAKVFLSVSASGPCEPAPGELFANELCALRLFETTGVTPRVLGVDAPRTIVLLEDLGVAPNLAELPLTKPRFEGACTFARTLARLHIEGHRRRHEYERSRLAMHAPKPYGHPVRSAPLLATALRELSIEMSVEWDPLPSVRALCAAVSNCAGFGGVAVVDICPENVLFDDEQAYVVDLEGACPSHVLLDAASLLIPFPNCVHPVALPDPHGIVSVYRSALAAGVPAARDEGQFARELRRCLAIWNVALAGRFLAPSGREGPPPQRGLEALARLGSDAGPPDDLLEPLRVGATALLGSLSSRS